jgi:hypothetical protein
MAQSARALMCLSKASSEDLLLLAGLLLCLLRFLSFLSHVTLRYPSGSMQVEIDMHKNEEYTKISKLIRRASNKVNGGGFERKISADDPWLTLLRK